MARGALAGPVARSPVISVVLVVALTVVLSALVGSTALGTANHSAHAALTAGSHTHWEAGDILVVEHQSGGADIGLAAGGVVGVGQQGKSGLAIDVLLSLS